MINFKSLIICIFVSFLTIIQYSCSPSKAENDKEELAKKSHIEKSVVEVSTDKVKSGSFSQELVSNGKLMARAKAVVPFKEEENIIGVFVHEGEKVEKGQLLAKIDPVSFEKKRNDAEINRKKALFELEDLLLGYGYSLDDTAKVPRNIKEMCFIKSEFRSSESEFKDAKRELDHTSIVAPIGGIVANLEAKVNNPSSEFKKCCEILDNSSMTVEFHVLEGEMSQVKEGQKVEVFPYALPNVSRIGVIKSINPTVEDGLVKITAEIPNTNNILIDGMNVQIKIKNEVPDCIIIPKSAVVYRQNRKVVFVHRDGVAYWVYVETGLENSSQVTITDDSLKPGEDVIVSNNLNLAHECPVKTVNNKQ